jgi:hypothetical protein
MILMWATSISRAIEKGGPWKSNLVWALKWPRAKRLPFGPTEVEILLQICILLHARLQPDPDYSEISRILTRGIPPFTLIQLRATYDFWSFFLKAWSKGKVFATRFFIKRILECTIRRKLIPVRNCTTMIYFLSNTTRNWTDFRIFATLAVSNCWTNFLY